MDLSALDGLSGDVHEMGRQAQLILHLDGFFMLFMSVRVVNAFRIFPYMDWLVKVLHLTVSRIATFYVAVLPFFMVMIVVLYFVSGANVLETSTLFRSIFTIIRFAFGIGNTSEYYPVNQYFYYIWSVIFVFYLYYFLIPVSIALFLEAYEEITTELGHVTDYSQIQQKNHFRRWLTMMPPWQLLAKRDQALRDAHEKERQGLLLDENDNSD